MKTFLKTFFGLLFALLVVAAAGLYFYSLPIARFALREAGLDNVDFESATATLSGVTLENVTVRGDFPVKIASLGISRHKELNIKDLSAAIGEVSLTGVNADVTMDSFSPPAFTRQVFTVEGLDAVLPLTRGRLEVSMDRGGSFTVHDSSWTLAKGTISTSPFTVMPPDITADVTLTALNVDLEELFKLAPMDGLDATGSVSGKIPVKIRKGDVAIVNGVLKTTSGGAIRYNPKEVPAFLQNTQNQIIDLRAALTAFNYDSLEMTLNGEAGKSQKISLKASGKNPGFYNGHPVVINFNVEGPLQSVIERTPMLHE